MSLSMARLRTAAVRLPAAVRARLLSTKSGTSLILEDGTRVGGTSFGSLSPVAGELVFNTGLTGYTEAITDPSYRGQLLVLTYPLIGNYGIPPEDVMDRLGLPKYFESSAPQVAGLVVANYAEQYSHWEATRSLGEWLGDHGVPAITGVDTRMLTKMIRERGSMKAKLVPDGADESATPLIDINERNLVADVSPSGVKTYHPDEAVAKAYAKRGRKAVHILAVDCGMKHSILRSLVERGATVTVVPWDHKFAAELQKPEYDALFLSNGPGDPSVCAATTEQLRQVVNSPAEQVKPIFGICLGHQLLSTAAGGSTYKLPYGHRSQNQPVIDVFSKRCFITSQNHGYAVNESKLSADWKPFMVNANDLTSEGIVHATRPYFSVQYHPEAKCGPVDTMYLFDDFLDIARGLRPHTDIIAGRTGQRPLLQSERDALPTPAEETDGKPPVLGSTMAKTGRLEDHVTLLADSQNPSIGQRGLSQAVSSTTLSSAAAAEDDTQERALADYTESPLYRKRHKVLILGSGGLQIGQAGEFDYSGSQAIKALKDEGVQTVLINPNIATVQTAEGLADSVYFLPVTSEFVTSIIEKERPDGIMLQFGGQTALNCGIELFDSGVLERFGVEVLGTSVDAIRATEDRQIFADKLTEINESIAPSISAVTVDESLKAADKIGYPVIVRSAFSLGGLGSGFAKDPVELRDLVTRALTASPQVLVEKSIKGWKELEYEVMRDAYDNTITVCNMENLDPLGVHTGDSIVVAPSQTLNDHEYHMLRQASINVVRHLGIVGECNVQFALSPDSRDYCIIECNPRLSRSSALASKATGYPLPLVAAKLALGHSLPSVVNSVNHTTTACFEPSLDYIVTKVPRWDLAKFSNVSRQLGSGMKSVGEVMAVGRSFEESLQKALRMVDQGVDGFADADHFQFSKQHLDRLLENPTDQRIWALAHAMDRGYTVEKLHEITKIDPWFLQRLANIHETARALGAAQGSGVADLTAEQVRQAKEHGFSDKRIASELPWDVTEDDVRARRKELGVTPVVKQIDTLAAEFPAKANYLYMTYHGQEHDIDFPAADATPDENDIMVLGGGGYRIGSSVEFDYSAVGTVRTLRGLGKTTSIVNFNPETVSTDYDESDRLFFEELSLERVLDIHDLQRPSGTVVSVGGQIPNTLALPLAQRGVKLLGTPADKIDNAEDRSKFSDLLDEIGVGQPAWSQLTDLESARKWCAGVGYPVLVRPSYVLSGGGMKVVNDEEQLGDWLENAGAVVSSEFPVVVSKMENGREIDFDAVAHNGEVLAYAVSEHVERAGVHSGDATLVLPSPDVSPELAASVLEVGKKMAKALNITGPFNSQVIALDGAGDGTDALKVIECNVRASRSLPFVSKALGVDFVELATRAMVDSGDLRPVDSYRPDLGYVCVKSPMFSFTRLLGADPLLGVEMASTGEVACFGKTKEEALVKSMMAATFVLPRKTVLLSTGSAVNKEAMLPYVRTLEGLGYTLYATPGTATHLEENGIKVETCYFDLDGTGMHPKAVSLLSNKDIDLVVNVPSTDKKDAKDEKSNCYLVRRAAVDYSVPLITNLEVFRGLVDSLSSVRELTTANYDDIKEIRALADAEARK